MGNIDISKYRATQEYVTVKVDPDDRRNRQYAKLLLDDYASNVSELTAVTQYEYANILAEDNHKVADTFLGIAIVEMNHLDMIGDTILELGTKPKYFDGNKKYWRSSVVPYGSSTRDRINIAIKSEKEAIHQYKKHVERIENKSIKALIKQIIEDEEYHIVLFNKLLEDLK